ncbi:haloacid dehalogenase-like hydrolase [Lactovum miscens]|uniref:Haloacid dehalogenase-like hydrolase n=1 Tax=Lactovum miscens TaxID=190387 RepID=A0A841C971_9LACT|nr:haloacid dehalogenase-like hydrolase [Lactovum miscens]MBB5888268.1 hypothetical protein [Lactovum miscens]
MVQNTIAIVWDFDKTLIREYMQTPIFDKFGVDQSQFWAEVEQLPKKYAEEGININRDLIYLNHMITCVHQGIFPGLNNEMLFDLGSQMKFYNGVPKIFDKLRSVVDDNDKYNDCRIKVEHYIISTGLTQMIKGSAVNEFIDGVWGCEFIERPFESKLLGHNSEPLLLQVDAGKVISQIGSIIDNTSKTRVVFELRKGVNKHPEINVNGKMDAEAYRIPFKNMIYIADGPSDVPVFSVLKKNGGKTFAVYPHGDENGLEQVDNLLQNGRIDAFGEADYTEGSTSFLWLKKKVEIMADRIYDEYLGEIAAATTVAPAHLTD